MGMMKLGMESATPIARLIHAAHSGDTLQLTDKVAMDELQSFLKDEFLKKQDWTNNLWYPEVLEPAMCILSSSCVERQKSFETWKQTWENLGLDEDLARDVFNISSAKLLPHKKLENNALIERAGQMLELPP